MRITEIRTRVVSWRGKTVPLPPHFCTNPMDLLELPEASMSTFTFHGWLVVEVFTDEDLVGVGNAALAPHVTKQTIDLYLKPLLIGLAKNEMAWCTREMLRASHDMGFGDDWHKALEHVKDMHVEPGEQPEAIRKLALEGIDYVESHDLVTVPPLAKETWRWDKKC